jgi:hypothetical protein
VKSFNKILVVMAVLIISVSEVRSEPPTLTNKFVPVQKTEMTMPTNFEGTLIVSVTKTITDKSIEPAVALIPENLTPPVKKIQEKIDLGLPKIRVAAVYNEKPSLSSTTLLLQRVGIENLDSAVSRARESLLERNRNINKPIELELACR